jgi:hypothetical protein
MSAATLEQLLKESEKLTTDEQLRLAAQLVERARQSYQAGAPRRKWRDIRGLAAPSLFGEDAQTYITRTRREDDDHREKQLISVR